MALEFREIENFGAVSLPTHLPTDSLVEIHADDGSTMVKVLRNGQVVYGPDVALGEAARVFWEAIAKSIPGDRCRGCA